MRPGEGFAEIAQLASHLRKLLRIISASRNFGFVVGFGHHALFTSLLGFVAAAGAEFEPKLT